MSIFLVTMTTIYPRSPGQPPVYHGNTHIHDAAVVFAFENHSLNLPHKLRLIGGFLAHYLSETIPVTIKSHTDMWDSDTRFCWVPTYGMPQQTAHPEGQTLSELLRALHCPLIGFVEQRLDASRESTNHPKGVAQYIEAKYQHVHLLDRLSTQTCR